MRLRELAAQVRFGYRRLTILLKREGWRVNAKRIYRLHREEGLTVRTKYRRKTASRSRVPHLSSGTVLRDRSSERQIILSFVRI